MSSGIAILLGAIGLGGVILAAMWVVRSSLRDNNDQAHAQQAALGLLQNQLHEVIQQNNQQIETLRTSVEGIQNRLQQSLESGRRDMDQRLGNTSRIMEQVQRSLGEIGEGQKQMIDVSRDLASLQDTLKAPKLRGSLGELFLNDVLAQTLPADHYETQYTFSGGMTVDAVIRLRAGLVPVDAKFPLENFTRLMQAETSEEEKSARRAFLRDVKKQIDGIASKYIRPAEETFDFALMYIPAENVYYETIIKDEVGGGDVSLFNYALERRVIPVSPNSFYAYLQTILLGLKGMRVEERAREILNHLGTLQNDLERFREDFRLVGKHLNDSAKKFTEADRRLGRMQDHMGQMDGRRDGLEESAPPLPPAAGT